MKRVFLSFAIALGLAVTPAASLVSSAPLASVSDVAYAAAAKCADGQVALSVPVLSNGSHCIDNDPSKGGAVVAYLKLILQLLAIAIGAVIMLMLVIGGIQYIVSAGDPGQVKNAKNRIVNAITALVLFMFAYAILNLVIPGGII